MATVLDDERWSLEVVDDGPGIPADKAASVFSRFGTGDDSGGGTGLGLAIASWVCELHGGSIHVLPTPPGARGARLRAVLPRHTRKHATATTEVAMTPTPAPTACGARPAARRRPPPATPGTAGPDRHALRAGSGPRRAWARSRSSSSAPC